VAQGKVEGVRGWLALLVGLLLLLRVWDAGHESRTKRLKRENERIDAMNSAGAAHGRSRVGDDS
jgi:hypothetical protein